MKGLLLGFLFLLVACSSSPVKVTKVDFFGDDLGYKSLITPLSENIRMLDASPVNKLKVGNRELDKKEYVSKLRLLLAFIETNNDKVLVNRLIERLFDVVEVQGDREGGKILLTAYYSPVLKGRLTADSKFTTPIYKKPENTQFTRSEIALKEPFKGQGLELCYLDPIDAFFLHVQGSGTVELENGEVLNLVFDGSNSKGYTSLGKELSARGIMQKEQVTLATLEAYLRSLTPAALTDTLNINESYIFFKQSEKKSLTTLGNEASAGRTIATDGDLFSKGLLGYLEFKKPSFAESDFSKAAEFTDTSRFVLDQDTGSAIKGTGRVDLFWGEGETAKAHAGVVKEAAKLYYLVPKS